MSGFEIDGLNEFIEKISLVEKRAPDKIINKLNRVGGKLRTAAKANTPMLKSKGKTIVKSYKLYPVEKVGGSYQKGIANTAPHFHLVENGHRKVTPSGNEVGFVEGQFFFEKTVKEMEQPIAAELEKWLDKLYKELK